MEELCLANRIFLAIYWKEQINNNNHFILNAVFVAHFF